jgi:hypothetical protein
LPNQRGLASRKTGIVGVLRPRAPLGTPAKSRTTRAGIHAPRCLTRRFRLQCGRALRCLRRKRRRASASCARSERLETSKRPSSTDQPRRHSAKARAHRPTARRRRPRRSVSALVQPEAAPSEGRSTPAMFVYRVELNGVRIAPPSANLQRTGLMPWAPACRRWSPPQSR